MTCPSCGCRETRVVDSRESDQDGTRRRRQCEACGARWSTREMPVEQRASWEERRTAAEALLQLAEMLRATAVLVTETAARLTVDPPTQSTGRPEETDERRLRRCDACGGLVWQRDWDEHGPMCPGQPTISSMAAHRLAQRLEKTP